MSPQEPHQAFFHWIILHLHDVPWAAPIPPQPSQMARELLLYTPRDTFFYTRWSAIHSLLCWLPSSAEWCCFGRHRSGRSGTPCTYKKRVSCPACKLWNSKTCLNPLQCLRQFSFSIAAQRAKKSDGNCTASLGERWGDAKDRHLASVLSITRVGSAFKKGQSVSQEWTILASITRLNAVWLSQVWKK